MATKIFLRNTTSDVSVGSETKKEALLTQGTTKVASDATATAAGPTSGVQVKIGTVVACWFTRPLAAVTLSSSNVVTFNLWGLESATQANAGFDVLVERCDINGNVISTVVRSERGAELAGTAGVNNWTLAPTTTSLNKGDRLKFTVFGNDAGGTMANGRTFTLDYDAATGVDGDSYISFVETITESKIVVAAARTFTLTGQAATLTRTRIMDAVLTEIKYDGSPQTLSKGWWLSAAQGSFAHAGQAAGLTRGLFLSAAQGSFAHAGQAATFEHGGAGPTSITINVGSGSFTATGQPAGMAEGGGAPAITVAVGQGSFVATGQPAGMAEGGGAPAITVAVGQGSFVATGQPAGLLEGGGIPPITVAVGTGSFVASGYEVGLSEAAPAGYLLTAGTGAFVRTGYAANLLRQRTLAASSRAFAVTGQATTLRRGRFITATRGTFTVSGSATGFKGERRLTAIAGAFLITGFAPNTKRNRIACATGFFSITGGRVDLDYDRTRSINIPVLNTTGFQIVEISDRWRLHTADFGDGYMSALTVGHPEGRRSWRVRIEALPGAAGFGYLRDDNPGFVLTEDQGHALTEGDGRIILDVATTRAQYLWNFFRNSKSKGDQPFWFEVEDPATGNRFDYVANFAADQLSYEVLCAQVYATGLELVERRLPPQNF